jgi:16S rRNA (guanine527-N7)-methyltransferase
MAKGREARDRSDRTDRTDRRDDVVFPLPSGELLAEGLSRLGFLERDSEFLGVPVRGRESIVPLAHKYLRELELFNSVFDLVATEVGTERGRQGLVVRHILDSLAPWKEIASLIARVDGATARATDDAGDNGILLASNEKTPRAAEIADVGSGAGFPGIPLAIAFPSARFTLVERMSKRCAFLENCAAILGVKNVNVLNAEVEKAPAGAYDVVAFRAFRPLERDMVRALKRLLKPAKPSADGETAILGGSLAAWKARRDKIELEMTAIAGELLSWKAIPTPVPFLEHEERNLVIAF